MKRGLAVVTGASGLLGGYITESLLARGQSVRALARTNSDCSLLSKLGAEIERGDLTDPAFAMRAIADAEIVYHCAGRIVNWGPWEDFERGNIIVTKNVAKACADHRVHRLLHVSSMAVYGHPRFGDELLTEEEPLGQRPWSFDYYNQSKIAAEQIVRELGSVATIVRPTWFYGPRDQAFVPRVLKKLRKGGVWIICGHELNGLYVTDLVDACIAAGESDAAAGQAYNLCNDQGITQKELFDILCEAFELPPVTRHVPFRLAHFVAHLTESIARWKGKKEPPSISRHALSVITRPVRFSIAKARNELNWKPGVSHPEGLLRTIEWMKRGERTDELVLTESPEAAVCANEAVDPDGHSSDDA